MRAFISQLYSVGRETKLLQFCIVASLLFNVHSAGDMSVNFHTGQLNEVFDVDDEPGNLCTGKFQSHVNHS